ncbi:unnamed protein product [Strongylus vulgaris]|uniref:Uncharacterized protein n=1 Tax=Strongylus vulgaris TaxID=40348 RepID=A0A3P7JEF6_STRVU|nr:unnamed protein product [Strongylus vulgaris]
MFTTQKLRTRRRQTCGQAFTASVHRCVNSVFSQYEKKGAERVKNLNLKHKKDPRLVVSAGNDGFVRVFNADTGEVQGAVQLQHQNDKVRGVAWSEVRPDLLAVQYYQHPTEFLSIEGGSEVSIEQL